MHGFDVVHCCRSPTRATSRRRTWLQIRQEKPDYVILWGWGVMNSDRHQGRRQDRLPA
jgi:branched-chain amino acid transport system substrate-binding protein